MGYRDDRRADRVAERAADREDRRLELEATLAAEAQRAEQRRLTEEAKGERARREAEARRRQELAEKRQREQDKQRRKAAGAAKRAKVVRWLTANPATLFVAYVMAASVVPALISQVGALANAGVLGFLAVLLASMLEGGAWALVFMGKQAETEGRETWKYRVAGWLTALAAGGINFWHWSAAAPLWVALVFGGSSVFAFFLWDLKTHSAGPTRAERRDAKARRKHTKARRKHHKEVAETADHLLSAMPFGAITESDAFAAAWRIQYGTEPGMNAELYGRATAARAELAKAFESAEETRPESIRAELMTGLLNPLPHSPGQGLPTLGAISPIPPLGGGAQGLTTQFPQGKRALSGSATSGPQSGTDKGAGNGSTGRRNDRKNRDWERHLPRAREVAVVLVAEGKTISATSLAKRLQIRREDAMKLRDVIVAERKGVPHPLHLVTDNGDDGEPPAAVVAGV